MMEERTNQINEETGIQAEKGRAADARRSKKNSKKGAIGGIIVLLCLVMSVTGMVVSILMYRQVDSRLPIDSKELAQTITNDIALQQQAEYDALRNAALRLENEKTDNGDKSKTSAQIIEEYLIGASHAKKHNLNMNNIKEEGQFKYYSEDGKIVSEAGIDVSYYQGIIDWEKVAASGKVDFVIIRLGFRGYGQEGKLVLDKTYLQNIQGAKEAGLKVGVYFFTQAITTEEALEEANFVIENLGDYRLDYPVYLDTEYISDTTARTNKANLSQKELSAICMTFCDRIEQAGYKSGIYANKGWFLKHLDMELLDKYDKWFAQYNDTTSWPFEMAMWQFACDGKIDGITGDIDLNIQFRK